MSRAIEIPEFWKLIEKNLNIDANGIQNMKEVLTLLDYTTIQSVSKLSQKKEIALIELEFKKLKDSKPNFDTLYPHLFKLEFGSGFQTILSDIAGKVKRRYSTVDIDLIRRKTCKAIASFCKEISESNVSVKGENGDVKCFVQCPICNKNSTLSAYWTNFGQEFRVANFQRHFESHGTGHDGMNELLHQNETLTSIYSSKSPAKIGYRTESVQQKRFVSPHDSPSENPVKSVRRIGDADFWNLCDTNKKLKYALQGDDKDVDKRKQQYLDGINEERKLLLKSVMRYHKNIRRFCRMRPKLPTEQNDKEYQYEILTNGVLKLITGSEHQDFKFDKIFDHDAKQDDIFDCVTPLIRQSLDGYSSCILAFGPTGSGKTFTIDGKDGENGILPRSVEYLLNHFEMQTIFGWKFALNISCARVSNEIFFDMIGKTDCLQIESLTKSTISVADEFKEFFNQLRREKEQTEKMNDIPSHYIMQLCLTGSHDGQDDNVTSTIVFIDLAGYENNVISLKEVTNAVKELQEGIEIVDEGASIMTKLLKLSLNDSCNTLMIAQLATLEDKFNVSVNALQSIKNSA